MAKSTPRIIIIGAGMAGILAGIKLKSAGIENFTIYEKASQIGGTWRENTYPGLTCDVPSHHYTYSFERNPRWTRHLPPGPEVQAYFIGVFEKYGLVAHTCFNEEAISARYQEGLWHLAFASGKNDEATVLIMASGVLHLD
ncbi:MAG: NAD(P)/FAD-dependent oxidoreductase, partial [Cellvibrionales bacterium]|nr:NAD(P)/FAD-dependent oxidoreductase [Cellvibrionales bacterium]